MINHVVRVSAFNNGVLWCWYVIRGPSLFTSSIVARLLSAIPGERVVETDETPGAEVRGSGDLDRPFSCASSVEFTCEFFLVELEMPELTCEEVCMCVCVCVFVCTCMCVCASIRAFLWIQCTHVHTPTPTHAHSHVHIHMHALTHISLLQTHTSKL